MASDLRTLSDLNKLFKYADDNTLISSEHCDVDVGVEFDHIKLWAAKNNMLLNMQKTKEIVFHRPNPRSFISPSSIPSIDQVLEAKLLGVTLSHNLKFDSHIKSMLSECSQRTYLLRQLLSQGLALSGIKTVYQAIIVSKPVLYYFQDSF
jgi:hypothetical protein